MRQVMDSFAGFDNFLVFLAISLVLLAAFIAIYVRITPHKEFALIREGNIGAAFSLSGAILGFVIPLGASIRYSVNLVDMAIWGVIALVVQIAAFVVVRLIGALDHRRHRARQRRPGLLPRLDRAGRGHAQRRVHELLGTQARGASMTQPRIFVDVRLGPGAQFALGADAAQHVGKALRLKTGDTIIVFDGRGGEYEAVIQRMDKEHVDVKAGAFRDVDREAPLAVGLVQGLPEADKMDWIIQKSVELGVAWIQPVVCDRSVVRLSGERAARREAHWRRVAVAACEQSGRNRVPEVRPDAGLP